MIFPYRLTSTRPQRPDLHFAKLHNAGAVLERNPPTQKLVVLPCGGTNPVKRITKVRAFRCDLVNIPLTARFQHRRRFGDIHDCAGTVIRIRPLVVNVNLVTSCVADLLRIYATKEDAAVRIRIDPELRSELKVGVGIPGNQIAVPVIRLDDAIRQPPVRLANNIPLLEVGTVEERDPAGIRGTRELLCTTEAKQCQNTYRAYCTASQRYRCSHRPLLNRFRVNVKR